MLVRPGGTSVTAQWSHSAALCARGVTAEHWDTGITALGCGSKIPVFQLLHWEAVPAAKTGSERHYTEGPFLSLSDHEVSKGCFGGWFQAFPAISSTVNSLFFFFYFLFFSFSLKQFLSCLAALCLCSSLPFPPPGAAAAPRGTSTTKGRPSGSVRSPAARLPA